MSFNPNKLQEARQTLRFNPDRLNEVKMSFDPQKLQQIKSNNLDIEPRQVSQEYAKGLSQTITKPIIKSTNISSPEEQNYGVSEKQREKIKQQVGFVPIPMPTELKQSEENSQMGIENSIGSRIVKWAENPLVKLPDIKDFYKNENIEKEYPVSAASYGIAKGLANMTTPQNVALITAIGKGGQIVKLVSKLVFGYMGGKGLTPDIKAFLKGSELEIIKAWKEKRFSDFGEIGITKIMEVLMVMGGVSGVHAKLGKFASEKIGKELLKMGGVTSEPVKISEPKPVGPTKELKEIRIIDGKEVPVYEQIVPKVEKPIETIPTMPIKEAEVPVLTPITPKPVELPIVKTVEELVSNPTLVDYVLKSPKIHTPEVIAKAQEIKGIEQPKPIEEITPEKLDLKNKIQQEPKHISEIEMEKKVFRWGYKEAKEMTTEKYKTKISDLKEKQRIIKEKLNTKLMDIKETQKTISNYAREYLPLSQRGKFLITLRDAKNQQDLAMAYSKIRDVEESFTKRILLRAIDKKTKLVNQSPSVSIVEKQKIREFMKTYPSHILTTLPSGRLENIFDTINILQKFGRNRFRTYTEQYETIKAYKLNKLLSDTVPINKIELKQKPIGEKLQIKDSTTNTLRNMMNKYNSIDRSLQTMNVFFDSLGGGTGTYDTAPIKTFKFTIDNDYGQHLNFKDNLIHKTRIIINQYNLNNNNYERIGVYAIKQQPTGMEKLLNSGYTKEKIDSIKLTPQENLLYNHMQQTFENLHPKINKFMMDNYNKEIGKIDNYSPFYTDYNKLDELAIWERFDTKKYLTKETEKGFTEHRKDIKGKTPIKINAYESFIKYIDNTSYLLNVGKDAKMLFEIANTPEFKTKAGDVGSVETLRWLDLIARNGRSIDIGRIKVLDMARKNSGIYMLGFRLSSALVQTTALLDGATHIGRYAFGGFYNVITSKNIRKFIVDNMPEVRDRIVDDPSFLDLSENQILASIQNISYKPLKFNDAITTSSISFGAYMKKLNELGIDFDINNPNKEALDYARLITQNTQASALPKDTPSAISRGGLTGNISLDRALEQFQTFMLTRWNNVKYNMFECGFIDGIKERNPQKIKKGIRIAFYTTLALMTEEGIRRGAKKGVQEITGEEDKRKYNYAKEVGINALQTIPFVSQAISVAMYGGEFLPTLSLPKKIVESSATIIRGKKPETKIRAGIELVGAMGGVAGLPTAQISDIIKKSIKEPKKSLTTIELREQENKKKIKERTKGKSDTIKQREEYFKNKFQKK